MSWTRVTEIDWATWNAVDVATLLFVIKDGRALLIRKKRGLGAGKINAPGGRLDPDASLYCRRRAVRTPSLGRSRAKLGRSRAKLDFKTAF